MADVSGEMIVASSRNYQAVDAAPDEKWSAVLELIELARETYLDDGEAYDLSWCAYFRRGEPGCDPKGICSFGCVDEPSCQTDHPSGGWPRERAVAALERLGIVAGPVDAE